MKIVLVTCPAYGRLHPPLSLACLTAALRHCSYQVTALDLNIQLYNEFSKEQRDVYWDLFNSQLWRDSSIVERIISKERLEAWVETILQKNPQAVGFSVYSSNEIVSLMLAEKIKKKNNGIQIIFGGPFIRRDNGVAQSIINNAYVDLVVIGEGEGALQEIAQAYEAKKEIMHCPGVLLKSGGQIVDCGQREPVHDLDSLPFSDFSDFRFEDYAEPLVPLLSSRGCLYNCGFCNEKTFWQSYRCRSAANVTEEIKQQILKYGINKFRFNDLMLNGNLEELEKFCDLIIQSGLKITWGGYISVRKMGSQLIKKMKESGCDFLFMGIESGSQSILNKFKKGIQIEVAEELLRGLSRAGISAHTGWIVGFPDESSVDFQQTLDFIKRNRSYMSYIAPANIMSIQPGSPVYQDPVKFGVKQIIHAGNWVDNITTLEIRQSRIKYFNKYIAS